MTMQFGTHHEWGKLREVVIGISPAEDFVVFYEHSQRRLVAHCRAKCSAALRTCFFRASKVQRDLHKKVA